MNELLETAIDYVQVFLYRYSFFIDANYYYNIWERYFNVSGFLSGAIIVVLIALAGADNKKTGFIRTLAIIAFINSIGYVYYMICSYFDIFEYYGWLDTYDLVVNPVSGAVIVLVIYSCYKGKAKNAFYFGVITYGVSFIMYGFSVDIDILGLFIVLRTVVLGLVCMLLIRPGYFYSSFIIFAAYYLIFRAIHVLITEGIGSSMFSSVSYIIGILIPDLIIFAVILAVSIIYERAVLTVKKPAVTT